MAAERALEAGATRCDPAGVPDLDRAVVARDKQAIAVRVLAVE